MGRRKETGETSAGSLEEKKETTETTVQSTRKQLYAIHIIGPEVEVVKACFDQEHPDPATSHKVQELVFSEIDGGELMVRVAGQDAKTGINNMIGLLEGIQRAVATSTDIDDEPEPDDSPPGSRTGKRQTNSRVSSVAPINADTGSEPEGTINIVDLNGEENEILQPVLRKMAG